MTVFGKFVINKAPFTRNRDEVNPGPSRIGHSIIYNRSLHETGMEKAQTGLRSQLHLCFGTTHAHATKRCKNNNGW